MTKLMRFFVRSFFQGGILLFLLLSFKVYGQKVDIFIGDQLFGSQVFQDSAALHRYIESRIRKLVFQGYPFARVDSIGDHHIRIHQGPAASLFIDSIRVSGISSPGPGSLRKPSKWLKVRLNEYINNGYPFATFQVVPHRIEGQDVVASISIDKGPHIVWDTLHLVKPIRTTKEFLSVLLDVPPGEEYSEQTYQDIEKKISRVSFLRLKSEPDISFGRGTAKTYLDIEEVPVSSFEGIMGVQANSDSNQPTSVTGFLNLDLENLFSSGKSFHLDWNRYDVQSQSMNIGFGYPFFLGSKILVDFDFHLLKQDSTFVNRAFEFSGSTFIGSKTLISGAYSRNVGSTLNTNTGATKTSLADFKTDWYSIRINHGRFDSPFRFESGIKAMGSVAIGHKEVVKNPNYPDSFYDTLLSESASYRLMLGIKGQQVVARRTALFESLKTGSIWNPNLLRNELFRLGGLKSLRGFNENFYFTSRFITGQLELRQYFEANSYFFGFTDLALIRNLNNYDIPYGFGGGFAINSNFGLFNFVLATGGSRSLRPDFANTKIHFGYQAVF